MSLHNRVLEEEEAKGKAQNLKIGRNPSNIALILIPTTIIRKIVGISLDVTSRQVLETTDEMILHKGIGTHLGRANRLDTIRLYLTVKKYLLDRGESMRVKDLGDNNNIVAKNAPIHEISTFFGDHYVED